MENRYDIELYFHYNNNSTVLTKTPLEEIKEFIKLINDSLETSKERKVIINKECILADVYTAAYNYCMLFNNIKVHYILNGEKVEIDKLFEVLNNGYDHVIDYVENMKRKHNEGELDLENINLKVLDQ